MGEFDRIIEFAIRTDVELYTAMPTGWRKITGSMTAPRGSTWIYWIRFITRENDYNLYLKGYKKNCQHT